MVLNYFQYLLHWHVCINKKHQVTELEKLRTSRYRKYPQFFIITIMGNFNYFRE